MSVNPYHPPDVTGPSLLGRELDLREMKPASLVRRLIAFLIDLAGLWALLVVGLPVGRAALFLLLTTAKARGADPGGFIVVLTFLLIVFGLAALIIGYFALPEGSRFRASIGKRVMGIQVVDLEGRRLSRGRAIWRAVLKILTLLPYGIGSIWAFFGPARQALHDRIAHTLVIRARPLVDLNIPDNFNAAELNLEPWMFESER